MSPQAATVMDRPRSRPKGLKGLSTRPGWKDPRVRAPSLDLHCLSPASETQAPPVGFSKKKVLSAHGFQGPDTKAQCWGRKRREACEHRHLTQVGASWQEAARWHRDGRQMSTV